MGVLFLPPLLANHSMRYVFVTGVSSHSLYLYLKGLFMYSFSSEAWDK